MSSSDLPPPIPTEAALILDKEGFKIPPPPPLGELPKSAAPTTPPPGLPTKPGLSQRSNPPPGFIQKSDEREKPETSAEPPAKRMKGMGFGWCLVNISLTPIFYCFPILHSFIHSGIFSVKGPTQERSHSSHN